MLPLLQRKGGKRGGVFPLHPRPLIDSPGLLLRPVNLIPLDLTGSHPEPASSTLAGTTHNLPLSTAYYTAEVPIWLDLIGSPSEWAESFLSPEAKEVLGVLGGLVVIFALPRAGHAPSPAASSAVPAPPGREQTKELISHVGGVVRDGLGGWEWDGVGLGIGVGDLGTDDPDALDEWEDACAEVGLEFVHVQTTAPSKGTEDEEARNEFGEKTGIARVLEALQSNDWAGGGLGGSDDDEDDEFGLGELDRPSHSIREHSDAGGAGDDDADLAPENLDFGFDRTDFEGLKKAIWSSGKHNEEDFASDSIDLPAQTAREDGTGKEQELGDEDVQKLERMFVKLQAVRDRTAGLPEEQRKKIAKQAVGEVMKEL